jgi:hypothetical protein
VSSETYVDDLIRALRATGTSDAAITDEVTTAIFGSAYPAGMLRPVIAAYVCAATRRPVAD